MITQIFPPQRLAGPPVAEKADYTDCFDMVLICVIKYNS